MNALPLDTLLATRTTTTPEALEVLRIEREVTRCFRELARFVGVFEAIALFNGAGLNDDRPTWAGKEDTAQELVDAHAYASMRE